MNELALPIVNEINNLKSLLMERRKSNFRKALIKIASQITEENKADFFDMIGELLRYNCDEFMQHGYYPLLPKFRKYLTEKGLVEMELFLINNFGLALEEKVLSVFKAVTILQKDKVIGHMYLTNKRIIALGELHQKGNSTSYRHGLISNIIREKADYTRRHIRKALHQTMQGDDVLLFGQQIPINGVFKVNRYRNQIVYLVYLEEQKGKKVKRRKLKVKIVPKPMKGETSRDFKANRDFALNTLEQLFKEF